MFVEEIGSAISLERFATYTSEMRERCDTFVDRTSEDEVVWEPIVCGSQRPSRIGGPGEVVSHSGLEHWGFPVDVITRGSGGIERVGRDRNLWYDYRLIELSTLPLNSAVFAPPRDFECVSSLNPRGAQPNRPDDCSKLGRLLSRIWGL